MANRTAVELANDWVAAYNGQDLEHLMSTTRPDASVSLAGGLISYDDASSWREHNVAEWATFPDAEFEITRTYTTEHGCALEGFWHATMEGDGAMPDGTVITATGGHTDLPLVFTFDVVDGEITRIAGYWSSMVAMAQLGIGG